MKLLSAIKNELYRKSPWDNGWKLVLFGAIPIVIFVGFCFLIEYFW